MAVAPDRLPETRVVRLSIQTPYSPTIEQRGIYRIELPDFHGTTQERGENVVDFPPRLGPGGVWGKDLMQALKSTSQEQTHPYSDRVHLSDQEIADLSDSYHHWRHRAP